jgi:hypothetical protein
MELLSRREHEVIECSGTLKQHLHLRLFGEVDDVAFDSGFWQRL